MFTMAVFLLMVLSVLTVMTPLLVPPAIITGWVLLFAFSKTRCLDSRLCINQESGVAESSR